MDLDGTVGALPGPRNDSGRLRALTTTRVEIGVTETVNILMATGVEQLRCGRPAEAVRTARKVARRIRDPVLRAINVGGFLIDAGADLKKVRLVKEAVDELERVSAQVTEPNRWAYHFNLGNGYSALGHRQKGRGPSTKPALVKAISHLDEALKRNPAPDVRANLGGALLAQGRWIEAFDESDAILQEFPTHHKALANRASSLCGIYHWVEGHTAILAAALSDIEHAVKLSQNEPVFQSSYKKTLADIRKHVSSLSVSPQTSLRRDVRWIWESRLALNPCPLCRQESPEAFDLFPLAARLEGVHRKPEVDVVLDLVNSLCRNYATARWVLYKAVADPPLESDHVITIGGNPSARHELPVGLLMSAALGFYALLGQIAFALNSYYRLGHDARDVTFENVWGRPGSRGLPKDRTILHPALQRRSVPALAALYWLAQSFTHGLGRYADLRKCRNSLEHHVVCAFDAPVESPYYVAFDRRRLEESTLLLGQIARAAIWYFGGAILYGEQERAERLIRRGRKVTKGIRGKVRRS